MTRTLHRLFLISLVERNFFRSYSLIMWCELVERCGWHHDAHVFTANHAEPLGWHICLSRCEAERRVTSWQSGRKAPRSRWCHHVPKWCHVRGRTVILCCSWNSPPSSLSLLTPTPHLSPLLPYSPSPVIPSSTGLSPSPSLRHIFSTHWTIQRQLISASLFLLPASLSLPLSQVL